MSLRLPLAHPKIDSNNLELLYLAAADCFHERRTCSKTCSPALGISKPSEPPFLPRRVIDIGDGEEAANSRVRLHESVLDERAQYTTLSHRWGDQIAERTMRKNITSRCTGIDTNILPKSFRDAITVTRKLGVRYLWIDAICIIQDDHADWIEQAPQMGKIYQHAYCTIAAHSAENSMTGFLESKPSDYILRIGCYKAKTGVSGTLHIGAPRSFDQAVDQSYLKRRAWALQELTMSRRTVHCSNGRMYWSCRHIAQPRPLGFKSELSANPSPTWRIFDRDVSTDESWFDLVTDYSKCELTYPSDKLAAISGIAMELQTRTDEIYRSGLFESSLPQGLLWFSGGQSLKRQDQRVPSWSWGSVDGPIQFMKTQHTSAEAEIVALGRNKPANGVVSATSFDNILVIIAAARETWIDATPVEFGIENSVAGSFLRPGGTTIGGLGLSRAGRGTFDAGNLKKQKVALCVRICTKRVRVEHVLLETYLVLLLAPSEHVLGRYRRIGVGIIYEHGWFDRSSPRRLEVM